jgi:hypothetical protein
VTRFLSMRAKDVGGPVQRPAVLDWTGTGYMPVADAVAASDVAGREVVLATHGFNVSRKSGTGGLANLEPLLGLQSHHRYLGVLWPGDFWLPVVNYPFQAAHAVTSGQYLAEYLNRHFASAASISLISHSLGARVVLECVQHLDRPAKEVCLTAGAVDADCMARQYLDAANNAGRITVLSSRKDKVLRLAYPSGDFISDVLLGDNDSPWKGALGLKGPPLPLQPPLIGEPIPQDAGFDRKGFNHGDYLPPRDLPSPLPSDPKWVHTAGYMGRAVTGQPSGWR